MKVLELVKDATEYKVGEKTSYEIGRFRITNEKAGSEDKDIIVKSLKLKNASED